MRTWCVSLTVRGTSQLVIHNFIVLFMCKRVTKAWGVCVWLFHLLLEPHAGLGHDPASGSSRSHTCRSPWRGWDSFMFQDPNAVQAVGVSWGSSVNEGSFLTVLFFLKKMSLMCIPKHFQHQTRKHWWMKNNHKSCVSVNSIAQATCGYGRVVI